MKSTKSIYLILIVSIIIISSSPSVVYSSILGPFLSYYDFIVVGGGASGGIIVDRLSEKGYNVLLLEAGGPSIADIDGTEYVGTKGTFDPTTNTYKANRALTKYEVPLYWQTASIVGPNWNIPGSSVGKMIGGSGTHNGMTFLRGTKEDFDNWNVTGWSWNDMLPYFKKFEKVLDPNLILDSNRGTNGSISIRTLPFDKEGSDFLQSCNASGIPFNSDFNQVSYRDGCGYMQFNINSDGERSSTTKEYLVRASKRSNVDIIYYATVTKIKWSFNLLSGKYDATGVEYSKNNQTTTVTMRKEVILASGALNTPKVLMVSGVGDASYLSGYSSYIPLIKNLTGVGKNLQNHVLVMNVYNLTDSDTISKRPNYYNLFQTDLTYSTTGKGVLGTPGYSVGMFLRKNSSVSGVTENLFGIFPGSIGGQFQHPVITTAISLSYPLNIHQVKLANITPGESTTNFLLKPPILKLSPILNDEVDILVRGIKESKRILSYPPLSNQIKDFIPEANLSDQDLRDWVKSNAANHEHWSCTCKMGQTTDPNSVVDPKLKVIGVNKVRICDSSVFPKITHSLVQATVMAVAEKCADLILSDYTTQSNSVILSASSEVTV